MEKDNTIISTLRHSASHLMAKAVCELFPGTKLGIGPSIETGFYYDFDTPKPITEEDLSKIEKKMKEYIKKGEPFEKFDLSKEEAKKLLAEKGEKYKLELLEDIPDEQASFYKTGEFVDLCRGPHVESTKKLKAFKLLSLAGAYWRGDEKNAMLQRIYGTAFETKDELAAHLKMLEEAEKRDHRKIGKELDLFNIYQEEAGAGFVYYHPKGAILRELIEDFEKKEHRKRGYQSVVIPHLAKIDLFKTSGHADYYRENMYFMEIDEKEHVVKPMNCPGHILIYKSKLRSHKDLPIRYFELGTVYRYERSGVLHGLLRVRGFTQDDAHIFCRPEDLQEEIDKVLDFADFMMKTFGFEYSIDLSTRPEKFVGTEENWEHATNALKNALKARGQEFAVDEGAGVFYGPKIDIKLKDAIGRMWQGPTVQVDFNLPERFNLSYIGEDGTKHRPVMVHRVVLGSIERFVGALVEHYAGAFPPWLSPVQVVIIPIADRHIDYAKQIAAELDEKEIRYELDDRREKMGYKIREAEKQKTPYIIIMGDKEVEDNNVAVRLRSIGDIGSIKKEDFYNNILKEIEEKQITMNDWR